MYIKMVSFLPVSLIFAQARFLCKYIKWLKRYLIDLINLN